MTKGAVVANPQIRHVEAPAVGAVLHAVERKDDAERRYTADVARLDAQPTRVRPSARHLDHDIAAASLDYADLTDEVIDRDAIPAQRVAFRRLRTARRRDRDRGQVA